MASPNRHVDYFHDFPEDIVRTILEAATSDTDEPSWACARVSRKVQGWTEPILYRHIRVEHTSASAILLARTVNSHPAKPAPFFATYVKSLFIDFWDGKEPTTIISILGACPNIVELHFSTSYLGEPFLGWKALSLEGIFKVGEAAHSPIHVFTFPFHIYIWSPGEPHVCILNPFGASLGWLPPPRTEMEFALLFVTTGLDTHVPSLRGWYQPPRHVCPGQELGTPYPYAAYGICPPHSPYPFYN